MKTEKIRRLVLTASFTALILILSFTPLGYLKIGPLSVSFITVPVAVGAIVLGPASGSFLGLVFGLTSLYQCFGMDAFGTTLLGINPLLTVITCILPRVLMGLLTGLIFRAFKKCGKKGIGVIVASIIAPILNTVLFMTSLCLCFYNTEFLQGFVTGLGATNVFLFIVLFVGWNAVAEIAAGVVLSPSISLAISKAFKHDF